MATVTLKAAACLNVRVLVQGIEVIHSDTFEIVNWAADFVGGCTFFIHILVVIIEEKKGFWRKQRQEETTTVTLNETFLRRQTNFEDAFFKRNASHFVKPRLKSLWFILPSSFAKQHCHWSQEEIRNIFIFSRNSAASGSQTRSGSRISEKVHSTQIFSRADF